MAAAAADSSEQFTNGGGMARACLCLTLEFMKRRPPLIFLVEVERSVAFERLEHREPLVQ